MFKWLKKLFTAAPPAKPPTWQALLAQSQNLTLTKDRIDLFESAFQTLAHDRDEWQEKAFERDDRYQAIRHILDIYADKGSWAAVGLEHTQRLWVAEEHGYTLAQRWLAENIEKETL